MLQLTAGVLALALNTGGVLAKLFSEAVESIDKGQLDEDADVWFDHQTPLPGGLQGVEVRGFDAACYLTFTHADGTGVLFCGDLICHDLDGPYRFPVQEGYFDAAGGAEDAERLLELPLTALCAAHATPSPDGCARSMRSTSAPMSLRRVLHIGPGPIPASSMTLTPHKGPDAAPVLELDSLMVLFHMLRSQTGSSGADDVEVKRVHAS